MLESSISEHIDWLIQEGYAIDILKMLLGENEYADPDAFEKLDTHSHRLRGMTIRHLEFLVNFGYDQETVKKDGRIHSTYPEYFNAWKLAGCPGISIVQLEQLRMDRDKKV